MKFFNSAIEYVEEDVLHSEYESLREIRAKINHTIDKRKIRRGLDTR